MGDIEVKKPSGRFKDQPPRNCHTEDDSGKDVLKEGRRPRIGVIRGRQRVARTFSATPRGGNQKRWSRWFGRFVDLTAYIAILGYTLVEIGQCL